MKSVVIEGQLRTDTGKKQLVICVHKDKYYV
jgi:hypothetical protein